MGKKLNEKFVEAYAQLDNACGKKFGLSSGGVTEYIDRLDRARFAPERNETLQVLNQYRELRNTLVHDSIQMKRGNVIQKADIRWVLDFAKKLNAQKDPISAYLKKARNLVKRRKNKKRAKKVFGVFFFILILLLIIAGGCVMTTALDPIIEQYGFTEYLDLARGYLPESIQPFEINLF